MNDFALISLFLSLLCFVLFSIIFSYTTSLSYRCVFLWFASVLALHRSAQSSPFENLATAHRCLLHMPCFRNDEVRIVGFSPHETWPPHRYAPMSFSLVRVASGVNSALSLSSSSRCMSFFTGGIFAILLQRFFLQFPLQPPSPGNVCELSAARGRRCFRRNVFFVVFLFYF